MQTELAQIISLTSYGNEFVKSQVIDEKYFPGNTVFQYCNSVDFRDIKKSVLFSKSIESISANNPIEWFKLLQTEGCKKIRLYYQPAPKNEFGPEYMLAGFAGGAGTWLIETCFKGYSHFWQKQWKVTHKGASDNKIWSVNYARILEKNPITDQQKDIDDTKLKFRDTLEQLTGLCAENDLTHWMDIFGKALRTLSSSEPGTLYYHHDLIVNKNYSLEAQQLLFAAGNAWVFGGMGSWNDIGFSNETTQKIYLKLSQNLYEQIIDGIIAATNSF